MARERSGRWSVIFGPLMGLIVACSGRGDTASTNDEELTAQQQLPLTSIIKTSNECDEGPGRQRCINVPPGAPPNTRGTPPPDPAPTGVRDEVAYARSTRVFFEETSIHQRGRVSLKVVQYAAQGSNRPTPRPFLHMFLEDIPIPMPVSTTDIARASKILVYLDHERFNGPTDRFDLKDRLFEFDIVNGPASSFRVLRYVGTGSSPGWKPCTTVTCPEVSQFQVALAGCKTSPTTGLQLCGAEVFMPLRADDLTPPGEGLQPGFGLAITNNNGGSPLGKFPENLASTDTDGQGRLADRTQLQTVLLSPPRGFPVSYMTWNVRRFGSPIAIGPFGEISNKKIGEFLAPFDIVAIQEGWDKEAVHYIFEAANEKRKQLQAQFPNQHFEPFLDPIGPIDFQDDVAEVMKNSVQSLALEATGTNGGLWLFSRFRQVAGDNHIYNACRDEDCFRAKGVQWARFNINPSPETFCRPFFQDPTNGYKDASNNCPLPPSGDHYIDVFNTHMQASNAFLCGFEDKIEAAKTKIGEGFINLVAKGLPFLAESVKYRAADDFNCINQPALVRGKQLQELNEFIQSVQGDKPDRPAVIMGDFNLDGKTLTGEYPAMLDTLRIGPTPSQNSDLINPFPDDWDFDIDHGDLLRQRKPKIDFSTGIPTGTYINDEGGTTVTGAPWAGNFDGEARFDYILVRPPFTPNDPSFLGARWMAATEPGTEVWSSPWPGLTGSFGGPPDRLSDHKPVVATIKHAPLEYLPNYHPNLPHRWEFRVVSADGSNQSDCWFCGSIDPLAKMSGLRYGTDAVLLSDTGEKTTPTCQEQSTISYPNDACMNEWRVEQPHTPFSGEFAHVGVATLYDADSASPDDRFKTTPVGEGIPFFRFIWDGGFGIGLAAVADQAVLGTLLSEVQPVTDQAPVQFCSRQGPTNICARISFEEVLP